MSPGDAVTPHSEGDLHPAPSATPQWNSQSEHSGVETAQPRSSCLSLPALLEQHLFLKMPAIHPQVSFTPRTLANPTPVK